mgnify:CR=1 FL=1
MVRLYRLGHCRYEQHCEGDELPESIVSYQAQSRGEMPPYIPLPEGTVTFRIVPEGCCGFDVAWQSSDPLPDSVLRYVCENGVLPPAKGGASAVRSESMNDNEDLDPAT